MWGIIAAIVVVIIVWGVLGGTFPSSGSNGGIPDGSGCELCKKLLFWWLGLSFWKRIWMGAWYNWKKVDCYLKGCPIG